MKKIFLLVLVFALFLAVAAQAQFSTEPLEFNNQTSTALITTISDTSDNFIIPMDWRYSARYGKDYPTKLSWQFNTVEVNDSTWVSFKYQFSLDGSYWLTAVPFDTLKLEDEIAVQSLTSWSTALYGRIICTAKLAAGDTVTVSGTYCKIY